MLRSTGEGQVFVAYAHEDGAKYLKSLVAMFPAALGDSMMPWTDQSIEVGDRWESRIESALSRATVCVLLVTPAFLKSKFIATTELPLILDRAEGEGLRLVPVLCEPCLWNHTSSPLSPYQLANSTAASIFELRGAARKQEWKKIVERIMTLLMARAGVVTVKLSDSQPAKEPALAERPRQRGQSISETGKALGDSPTIVEMYELVQTIYANGYALTHRKLRVAARAGTTLLHGFYHHPNDAGVARGFSLPLIEKLLDNGGRELPYPAQSFLAVAPAGVSDPSFRFLTSRKGNPLRSFEVSFSSSGVHTYQWMWGAPYYLNPTRPSWEQLVLGGRKILRLRVRLRIRNRLDRTVRPSWLFVDRNEASDFESSGSILARKRWPTEKELVHMREISPVERNPLFDCYEKVFSENDLEPLKDIALIY